MSVEALPRASKPTAILFLCLVAALLWHAMGPTAYYRNIAVYLEGPLPAVAGAAIGLWLHADDRPPVPVLAACFWAIIASLAVVLVAGSLAFGPFSAARGAFLLLRNGVRLPFAALLTANGPPVYLFWAGIKTALVWGAAAYLVLLALRPESRDRLQTLAAGYGEQRAFTREQRQQARDYRRIYLEAVRSGQAPPAPPPILSAPVLGSRWNGRIQLFYWLLKIGLAIAGAFGLYAAFQQQLADTFAGALLRGLLGG